MCRRHHGQNTRAERIRRRDIEMKPKRRGLGLEIRTFVGEQNTYVVFRTASGEFHVFAEAQAKDELGIAARQRAREVHKRSGRKCGTAKLRPNHDLSIRPIPLIPQTLRMSWRIVRCRQSAVAHFLHPAIGCEMPGPLHLPLRPPLPTIAGALGANYVRTRDWQPGPMAPPPAYKYPDVWKGKRHKKQTPP
jgi:hypothetical protein